MTYRYISWHPYYLQLQKIITCFTLFSSPTPITFTGISCWVTHTMFTTATTISNISTWNYTTSFYYYCYYFLLLTFFFFLFYYKYYFYFYDYNHCYCFYWSIIVRIYFVDSCKFLSYSPFTLLNPNNWLFTHY
jgi:hypothetical protein